MYYRCFLKYKRTHLEQFSKILSNRNILQGMGKKGGPYLRSQKRHTRKNLYPDSASKINKHAFHQFQKTRLMIAKRNGTGNEKFISRTKLLRTKLVFKIFSSICQDLNNYLSRQIPTRFPN